MVTRGQIVDIDLGTNTCLVRIPIFETSGTGEKALLTATIAIPPGVHTGYQRGDVVFLTFCDNTLSLPIVIGKLYLGAAEELKAHKQVGWVGCSELEVETGGSAQLPLSKTHIINDTANSDYGDTTLLDLVNRIQTLEATVQQLRNTLNAFAIVGVLDGLLTNPSSPLNS